MRVFIVYRSEWKTIGMVVGPAKNDFQVLVEKAAK